MEIEIMKKTTVLMAVLLSTAVQAEVSMIDSGKTVTLATAGVSVTIDKGKARITELVQNGQSLLAPGQPGYFTMIAGEGSKRDTVLDIKNCTFKKHIVTADTIDLAFTPERSGQFPFDMEIHYVMRASEPGFYFYLVAAKDGDTTNTTISQFRFAMRVDHSMLNIRLNDERFGVLPTTADIRNTQGQVMDATYLTPAGEIVTKYEWSSRTSEVPVYGLNNGRQGVWMIRGGSDYLNGGPTKQHNTCHATDKGPILLNLFYSGHYGSSGSYVAGEYEKVFGPTFVYLNQARDPEALWADAKRQEAALGKAWPYQWMKQPEYPVERATVSGRFEDVDNGWVVLARPTESRGLDWQQQGSDAYIARAPVQADGSFRLSAVRSGSYSLYAFADGMVGEFRRDNVVVDVLGEIQLGTLPWTSRSFGNKLWRIGTPDRSAAEFRHGDDYRHWGLWFNYEKEFPHDVDFVIGQSQERTDWNYAQMAVWEEEGGWKPKLDAKVGEGSWKLPVWKVRFNCDGPMQGNATLTLALAGVNREGSIVVSLNGSPVGTVDDLAADSSIHRSGIYGFFRERFVSFDASLLNDGENVITLEIVPAKRLKSRVNYSTFGVMYDFVELEIGAKETTTMTDEQAFNVANGGQWAGVFNDSLMSDWQEHWFLDGEVGTVTTGPQGMELIAGPEFKNDAHHMVLWTKEAFEGDLKIEYDYTRLDDETRCVNILYIQATGSGEEPYTKDIKEWSDLRRIPAMSMYFDHMNTYHISYAAFPNDDDSTSYIRARRYMPNATGLNGTDLEPDYYPAGLFESDVPHHITVIKKQRDIFMRIENAEQTLYFHMLNPDLPAVTEGRVGLRHMFTRSARYKDFQISVPQK
jgi:rhamnogalacturonan endolyase